MAAGHVTCEMDAKRTPATDNNLSLWRHLVVTSSLQQLQQQHTHTHTHTRNNEIIRLPPPRRFLFTRRLSVCLSVCLLASSRRNCWSDFYENFVVDVVPLDREVSCKCWTSCHADADVLCALWVWVIIIVSSSS